MQNLLKIFSTFDQFFFFWNFVILFRISLKFSSYFIDSLLNFETWN